MRTLGSSAIGSCRAIAAITSGQDNHGVNHGVDLDSGAFDGAQHTSKCPTSDSLKLGTGDFAICAWVYTDEGTRRHRRRRDRYVRSGAAAEESRCRSIPAPADINRRAPIATFILESTTRRSTDWQDCGHPNPTSNYVSNSHDRVQGQVCMRARPMAKTSRIGATFIVMKASDKWTDCGRVGDRATTGVGAADRSQRRLVRCDDAHTIGRASRRGGYDPGRVYRYLGGTQWEDCGQPSDNRTLNSMASYKGKLYVGGGPQHAWRFRPRRRFAMDAVEAVSEGRTAELLSACDVPSQRQAVRCISRSRTRSTATSGRTSATPCLRRPGLVSPDAFDADLSRKAPCRHVAGRQSGGVSRRRRLEGHGPRGRGRHRGQCACCLQRKALRRFDSSRRGLPL